MAGFISLTRHLPSSGGLGATTRKAPPRWSKRSRYSVAVRFLRLAFPILAVLLFLTVALWRDLVPNPQLIGMEASALPSSEVEELTMISPRFDGLDKDGQPYTLTASRANQENEAGDLIFLEMPAADMTLTSGRWVAVNATGGRYYRQRERLELEGQVNLFHDDGFEMETSSVAVDLNSGLIDSSTPVSGHGPRGELQAQGITVGENGSVINLKGRSRVVLLPDDSGAPNL
ncbi:MAG: hypothetical protein Kilf2KO_36890 [Rhodospirillales bacterium]